MYHSSLVFVLLEFGRFTRKIKNPSSQEGQLIAGKSHQRRSHYESGRNSKRKKKMKIKIFILIEIL